MSESSASPPPVERQAMDVDIVCVGFGPATAGFLATLGRGLANDDGTPRFESPSAPGLPLQVICYERADDVGFAVSGVVTRARAIRATFPELNPAEIPMAAPVAQEKLVYLLDPAGASRRPFLLRAVDRVLRLARVRHAAVELPYLPEFLAKHDGLVLSLGQFQQWVNQQVLASGAVQVWPCTPVAEPLIEDRRVTGVRLADQGTDAQGNPTEVYLPGMDVRAALTVAGDGPVGAFGRALDERFGLPPGHTREEWAVGMKMVIDLLPGCTLETGTVIHTIGYPEPEIFGFLYVHPERVASAGIFVPSWFDSPVRTAYRYLQHYIQHPYLWRHLQGGALRSWGAKSLFESGRRGEPLLAGDGYARIGEGSGTTNVLTGSGVDEAWCSGVLLAEAVLELLAASKPFSKENLEATYVARRRASWLDREARLAEKARDGFHHGFLTGMIGMALAGFTGGRVSIPAKGRPSWKTQSLEEYYAGRIPREEIARLRRECAREGKSLHDALLTRSGWPAIPYDGRLLVTHQDALLMGGKVQAPPSAFDHVVFLYPNLCETCGARVCVEICSGEAIHPGEAGAPVFDREKCVHCGACFWNCGVRTPEGRTNLQFQAGFGGLHSSEN